MNIKIDLNINANEELANALLTTIRKVISPSSIGGGDCLNIITTVRVKSPSEVVNNSMVDDALTLAAVMHNTVPSYSRVIKTSEEANKVEQKNAAEAECVMSKDAKEDVEAVTYEVDTKQEIKGATLEVVRTKIAELSQVGKQLQIKELLKKFGAKKVTEVPEEKYADLLREAEKIYV